MSERSSRIRGGKRKRKVYSLERNGIEETKKIKNTLMEEGVKFFDLDGKVSEGKVSEIVASAGNVSFVQLVNELEQSEILDPTLLRRRAAKPEVRPVDFSRTSPRQERFCGRDLEMKKILDAIERGRVVVIQGIAGIGKTALASRVCSEVKKSRSVFWYEFRKWHSLLGILNELSGFLEAMGARRLSKNLRTERKLDMEKVKSILQKDLDTGRIVLFFDDLQKANDEIVDFLFHLNRIAKVNRELAMVLMTRESIPFYDRKDVEVEHTVVEIQLLGLDRTSSKELLGESVEEFGVFDEVYAATQGHPLFLELVGSIPMIGPEPRLTYIDQFIEEEIYSELDTSEKKMMKVASVFENPVQTSQLLLDETVNLDTFLRLKKKTLIGSLEDGRAQVHDVVRKPFLSMLTPQERDRYHLWAAESLMREEDETLQIEAVHHLLITGDHSWAARVLENIGKRLIENGYDEELLSVLMEFDPRMMDARERGVVTEVEGDVLRARGHVDDAIKKLTESCAFYKKGDDAVRAARAGRKLGSVYSSIGKFEEGLKAYTKALSAIGKTSQTLETARILGGIGLIMARTGRYEKAVEYLLKDLAIAKNEGASDEIARVLNHLGYVFYETGAHDRALKLQKLSLETRERILAEWKKYFEL